VHATMCARKKRAVNSGVIPVRFSTLAWAETQKAAKIARTNEGSAVMPCQCSTAWPKPIRACRVSVQVIWTQGSTQGGSSGSPLIDVATRRIVGVLTGGVSTCNTRSSPDYFGRLSRVCPAPPPQLVARTFLTGRDPCLFQR
jgi:V8-like Glu-specific endopeptidase